MRDSKNDDYGYECGWMSSGCYYIPPQPVGTKVTWVGDKPQVRAWFLRLQLAADLDA